MSLRCNDSCARDCERTRCRRLGAAAGNRIEKLESGRIPIGRQGQPHRLWDRRRGGRLRSEEHTSELQSLMRISYAVFCLKKKNNAHITQTKKTQQRTTKA